MSILKREKPEVKDRHVSDDNDSYLVMPWWLNKLYILKELDTKEEWKIDQTSKYIYIYLANWGKCQGYQSIIPTQEQISYALGIRLRTVQRKLKILAKAGLIDIIRTRAKDSNFTYNRYRVHKPSAISRRLWINIHDQVMKDDVYKFKPEKFQKV